MTAEVHAIPVEHKVGFPPCPEVVKEVEHLLELAKAGKITGIATACVYHDDLCIDGTTGTGWAHSAGTGHAMGAAIAALNWRWQAKRAKDAGFEP